MADATLKISDRFPVGTSVKAYPAAQVGETLRPGPKRELPGGAVAAATATVAADGSLTFSGLTAGVPYVAAAQVSGEWRYVQFGAGGFVSPARIPHPYGS